MKIVQALWFNKNKTQIDFSAGWLDVRYHLMSWALSSLLLKRHNKSIELITDNVGFDLLINQLSLPYTTVNLALEHFENPIADQFWALKKIYAYSIHEEPFLFVDGDVFYFDSFQLDNEKIIAQNFENQFSFYYPVQEAIKRTCNVVGSYLDNPQLNAINTGIIGGQDFKFFSYFKNEIFDFAINNKLALHEIVNKYNIEAKYVNVWLEQYCLYNYAKFNNKQVSFYLKNKIVLEDDYRYLADFAHLPSSQVFLHIMHLAKINPTVCEQLAQRLYLESPEMHRRVEDVCRQLRSTHHFLNNVDSYRLPFERTAYLLKEIFISSDLPNGFENEYNRIKNSDKFYYRPKQENRYGRCTSV